MAPIKLLSSDLDGTIIFDRTIGPDSIQAIHQWQQAGNIAVCSTGKSIEATRFALRDSGLEFDYNVLYTGAVLVSSDYSVLRASTLPDGLAEEILDLLQGEDGVTVFATTLDGDLQLYDSLGSDTRLLTLFSRASCTDLLGRTLVGVPLRIADAALLARTQAEIEHRWGGTVTVFRNQNFLDIVPLGSSKGAGLRALVDLLTAVDGPYSGESIEIWSVGDSWNDIPMHRAAAHAVAMSDSPAEVTDACEATTVSVARLIDRVLAADSGRSR